MKSNMKKITTIVLALASVFALASCEREFEKTEVGTAMVAPVLQGVSDQIVDANNSKAEFVIFNWSPADFGAPIQVQYTLYMTKEGKDDVLIGQTYATSVAVEKATINSGAVALGIDKNSTGSVGAKVVASVYTGSSNSYAMSVSSNAIAFNVTTFEAAKDFIFLPGVYNGWGDSNDQEKWRVWEMDGGSKVYRTLVEFKEADWEAGYGFCPFKLYAGGAWLGYNDGYEPAWGRIFVNDDGNWAVPASEPINFITVNMTTKKGTREHVTSVGLIGSFAESGWDHDVLFRYDNTENVWVAGPVTFTASDAFLIRLNGNWDGENKYGTATSISSDIQGGYELENGTQAADIASPGSGQYLVKLYTNRTPFVITYEKQ